MVIIIAKRVFPSLFDHCYMELLFSAEKNLVATITPCIKAVINMEDTCPLNFDKFHL